MKVSSRQYLTKDLAGIGGRIKARPEDFEVEEIGAYEPGGEGTHLYLWVEKRDAAGDWMAGELARRFEVPRGDVGIAGVKDRYAVTRQWVSVSMETAKALDETHVVGPINEQITVLRAVRHNNKLKTGHLAGNRFRVVIRDFEGAAEESLARVKAVVEQFAAPGGMPNYYGSQRFGRNGSTLELGYGLLKGDGRAKKRVGRDAFLRRMAISALQSELFNRVLTARMEAGLWQQVLEGDILQKVDSGGLFVVGPDEVAVSQERFLAGEVVLTGPMFGSKMKAPAGAAAEFEAAVLADAGIELGEFGRLGKLGLGTRRALQVGLGEVEVARVPGVLGEEGSVEDGLGEGILLGFTLPSGSYATVLLDEVTKTLSFEISEA